MRVLHLQAGGVGRVHDDGASRLIPAAAQHLIHHHLGHHAVHLMSCRKLSQQGLAVHMTAHTMLQKGSTITILQKGSTLALIFACLSCS